MAVLRGVSPDDARAWASYVRALRAEIAEQKAAGNLPPDLRAPEPVHRTLLAILDAIDHLPSAAAATDLDLPAQRPLQVFACYMSVIHTWADGLVRNGVLTTTRPAAADRFWARMESVGEVPWSAS